MTTRKPLVQISGTIQELASGDSLAGLAVGVDVQAYDADIPTTAASQAEMESGTEAALRSMSPLRVKQAIAALASTAGNWDGGYPNSVYGGINSIDAGGV